MDGAERPDRPRRGREQAPEAAHALDRLVGALEHSRYSRHPERFTAERFAGDADLVEQALAAGVTPREVAPGPSGGRPPSWDGVRPGVPRASRSTRSRTDTPVDTEATRTVDELVG